VLTARAPRGVKKIVVQVRKGAFRASGKLRKRLGGRPRLAFRLRTAEAVRIAGAGRGVTKQTLIVRGKR
jgi:hypothetical protein